MRKTQHLDTNRRVSLEEKCHQRAMFIPLTEVKVIIYNSAVQSLIISLCACIHVLQKRKKILPIYIYIYYIIICMHLHALIFVM